MKTQYTFLDLVGFFENRPDILQNLEVAFRVFRLGNRNDTFSSLAAALDRMGTWALTPQGNAYWSHIHSALDFDVSAEGIHPPPPLRNSGSGRIVVETDTPLGTVRSIHATIWEDMWRESGDAPF